MKSQTNMAEQNDATSEKPCRTCTDFKTWSLSNKKKITNQETSDKKPAEKITSAHPECPLDKDDLGRSTWNLLHTVAAVYPEKPTEFDEKRAETFFKSVALSYPCEVCAEDFQKQIERFPPKTDSQDALSQWLCRAHNRINLRLGKSQFDCKFVNQRWRDGWNDGSCD